MAEKSLLEKLEGLQHKFEEISTLITDPSVISDQKRYVKLNKEYHDLEKILSAKNEYELALGHLAEAKELLDSETDPEMREMAKAEVDEIEPRILVIIFAASSTPIMPAAATTVSNFTSDPALRK